MEKEQRNFWRFFWKGFKKKKKGFVGGVGSLDSWQTAKNEWGSSHFGNSVTELMECDSWDASDATVNILLLFLRLFWKKIGQLSAHRPLLCLWDAFSDAELTGDICWIGGTTCWYRLKELCISSLSVTFYASVSINGVPYFAIYMQGSWFFSFFSGHFVMGDL